MRNNLEGVGNLAVSIALIVEPIMNGFSREKLHGNVQLARCNNIGLLFTIVQRVIVAPFYTTSTCGFVSMIIPLLPRIGSLPLR